MKFGVNYVPSNGWFYSWTDPDISSTKEDFVAIKKIGFDHIRLHLRWDLFQPNPSYYPVCFYDKLEKILSIADEIGLEVYISVFTGWMSGFWFLPSYVGNKNAVLDEQMIQYEKMFIDRIAESVLKYNSFSGIDLGNEFNVYEMEHHFSIEDGDRWLNVLSKYCMEKFKGKEIVFGVDHQPWFSDTQFSRKSLSTCGTATSLHTWIEFCGATKFGRDSTEVMSLQEYNIELANAYSENETRKIWLQEFGVLNTWIDEDKFEHFIRTTMFNALRSENVWGFTWWCSHEIKKEYEVIHPLEKQFGLLSVDNKLKPLGTYLRDCIADIKRGVCAPALKKGVAIVIDENKPFVGWDYAKKYSRLIESGIHSKFVLSSKINDQAYLKKREIKDLIEL